MDQKYDLVNFHKQLDDLTKLYTPNAFSNFPYMTKSNKKRKFCYVGCISSSSYAIHQKLMEHFANFVLFTPMQAGISNQQLGILCKKAYHNWKNALEDFRHHEIMKYHCNEVPERAKI